MIEVLPREVAQEAIVPTRSLTEFSRRMWARSLASVGICYFEANRLRAQLETFPACLSVPGIPRGQPSYQRALHKSRIFILASVAESVRT